KSVVINYSQLSFPEQLEQEQADLIQRQKAEYRQDLNNLRNQLSVLTQQVRQKQQDLVEIQSRVKSLRQGYEFAKKELEITQPLA
ncbi:HlyD family type I secretion periplasmic adaptor subunit, partial [Vibrio parahaemolyticus]|nr:HlyD family type I secretion periplasmic adaptor subunit [Vibrio parahaemolyticus]